LVPTEGLTAPGVKFMGDNVNKAVRTRYMRNSKYRDQSLDYFHLSAIFNRIDFNAYPDVHSPTCLDAPERRAKCLLPSVKDDASLHSNMGILVSRVLADHMPFFKFTFDDVMEWHLKHKHYAEMSSKSVVVSNT
jgi:hypothetical protein